MLPRHSVCWIYNRSKTGGPPIAHGQTADTALHCPMRLESRLHVDPTVTTGPGGGTVIPEIYAAGGTRGAGMGGYRRSGYEQSMARPFSTCCISSIRCAWGAWACTHACVNRVWADKARRMGHALLRSSLTRPLDCDRAGDLHLRGSEHGNRGCSIVAWKESTQLDETPHGCLYVLLFSFLFGSEARGRCKPCQESVQDC